MSKSFPSARQLQYFIAVAEANGFRGAAERLEVSQPTLTNQILALEEALGVTLFERSRAGTHPTAPARELLPAARRVLESFQNLVDRANSLSQGPTGVYRLGVSPTLGPYLLPLVLPLLHKRYDTLRFHVREYVPRDLAPGLANGELDVILGPLPMDEVGFEVLPLFREPLHLVFPGDHPLARRPHVTRKDLAGQPVLAMEEHHHIHQQIQRLCDDFGARILRNYEGNSLDALRQMAVMGMGITFLPALYVRSEIRRAHDLRVTQVRGEDLHRTHALVWRRDTPARQLFSEIGEEIRTFAARSLAKWVEVLAKPADQSA